MTKTPIEKFQQAVQKELEKYAEETADKVNVITRTIAKKGAQAVKNASAQAYGSGRYSKSWTATVEEKRYGTEAVIHSKVPGLPHLLEHGHAKRNGGRVPGRAHIAPVEEKIVEEFERTVKNDL